MNNYRSKKAQEKIIGTYDQLVNEWGIKTEEMLLNTTYGVTHVITAGQDDGKPLILFHGVGDDSALMWLYNAKAFAQHYKIYAIDTIGGPGKSTMGEKYDQDYDDVKWIEEIMRHLKLNKANFIGVSHGGYLVQLFALKKREMVDKAICISASVPSGNKNGSMKTMMKIFFPEALFPTKSNTIKLLTKLSGTNASAFTDNSLLLDHFCALLKGFNNMAMKYHKIIPFTDEDIASIKQYTYYLVGDEDPFEKLGGKNALLKHDMNVRFYPSAGHGLNHELPDEINQIIIDILEGNVDDIRNANIK